MRHVVIGETSTQAQIPGIGRLYGTSAEAAAAVERLAGGVGSRFSARARLYPVEMRHHLRVRKRQFKFICLSALDKTDIMQTSGKLKINLRIINPGELLLSRFLQT